MKCFGHKVATPAEVASVTDDEVLLQALVIAWALDKKGAEATVSSVVATATDMLEHSATGDAVAARLSGLAGDFLALVDLADRLSRRMS